MAEQPEIVDEIKVALLSGYGNIAVVQTFTHGIGFQVKLRNRKVGPVLLPPEGGTIADVLHSIGQMIIDA